MRALIALAFVSLTCAWTSAAWAHDVAVSGQVSRTPATADSPATGSNTGSVFGSWDINDDWSLDATLGITRASLTGDPSVVKAGNVYALGIGPSWTLGDNWLFLGMASFSPKSTQLTQSTLSFDDKAAPTGVKDHEAQIRADSTSGGLMVSASYDTADSDADEPENWTTNVMATAAWNHYGTRQDIVEVQVGGKTVAKDTLAAECANQTNKSCKLLKTLLAAQDDALDQGSLGVLVTETIHQNWDAILGGTYYMYSKDPNDVGVFAVATRGTQVVGPKTGGGGGLEYGEGIALSAFRFNTQFGAAWHAHGWKVTVMQAIGRYVDDGGGLAATTLKTSYKFNKNWKLAGSLTFQRDTDSSGAATAGLLGSLTLRFAW
jgi:hypothetical protein